MAGMQQMRNAMVSMSIDWMRDVGGRRLVVLRQGYGIQLRMLSWRGSWRLKVTTTA